MSDAAAPALEMRGVAKRFGDVVALDGVDLVVRPATVHALLGENGAGKSTLMRIAHGLHGADRGSVHVFGRPAPASVGDAIRRGVGMVHQHLSLVPNLSTTENLVLGGSGAYHPHQARQQLERVAAESGLRVPADVRVAELSIVEQQRLEILKALARGARLLILDEPSAVLAPSETEELLRWVRAFADAGGSVVLVTHKLKEALSVADDVTVLRRGRVAHSGAAAETSTDQLARAMFPDATAAEPTPASTRGEVVARAEALTLVDSHGVARIRAASLEIARGEVVGVAAVEGSGHRELLAAFAGLRPGSSGKVDLPPRIALIPADRGREALIPELSLTENVGLRGLGVRRGLMPWKELADRTASIIDRFSIAAPSPGIAVRQLSGGNQQRVVVGRELEHPVDLVVADNATRGLDFRATAFVHAQLRGAAAGGAGVIFHSSDLDEVLAVATRILVVFNGEVFESSLDREAISRAMLGASRTASV